MNNIIVFAGTSSKNSINKQLAVYASSLIQSKSVDILDLNDYDLPLFSIDEEKEKGFPKAAIDFDKKIAECAGIILSLAEHNGSYTVVFKNLFDWLSRIDMKTWKGKPMLLMSTSPGGRGGEGVLAAASDRFPRHDANIVEVFSLANFAKNFVDGEIVDPLKNKELKEAILKLEQSI